MAEELDLTLEALEDIYRDRRRRGWDCRVYDYTSNSWLDAGSAFARPGTYERAVIEGPAGERLRVRISPGGSRGFAVDAASVGSVGVWRSMGVDLAARHITLLQELLEGRDGPVPIAEIGGLLAARDDAVALEALRALGPLLPLAGEGPFEGRRGRK